MLSPTVEMLANYAGGNPRAFETLLVAGCHCLCPERGRQDLQQKQTALSRTTVESKLLKQVWLCCHILCMKPRGSCGVCSCFGRPPGAVMDLLQRFKPTFLCLQLLEGQGWSRDFLRHLCIHADWLLRSRQDHMTKWLKNAYFPVAQAIIRVQLMATEVRWQDPVMGPGAPAPLARLTWNNLECELHPVPALPCPLDCNFSCVVHLSAADGLLALQPVPWRQSSDPLTLSQDVVWCIVFMPYMVFLIWTREVHRLSPGPTFAFALDAPHHIL